MPRLKRRTYSRDFSLGRRRSSTALTSPDALSVTNTLSLPASANSNSNSTSNSNSNSILNSNSSVTSNSNSSPSATVVPYLRSVSVLNSNRTNSFANSTMKINVIPAEASPGTRSNSIFKTTNPNSLSNLKPISNPISKSNSNSQAKPDSVSRDLVPVDIDSDTDIQPPAKPDILPPSLWKRRVQSGDEEANEKKSQVCYIIIK